MSIIMITARTSTSPELHITIHTLITMINSTILVITTSNLLSKIITTEQKGASQNIRSPVQNRTTVQIVRERMWQERKYRSPVSIGGIDAGKPH
jgi:hypothetical protein